MARTGSSRGLSGTRASPSARRGIRIRRGASAILRAATSGPSRAGGRPREGGAGSSPRAPRGRARSASRDLGQGRSRHPEARGRPPRVSARGGGSRQARASRRRRTHVPAIEPLARELSSRRRAPVAVARRTGQWRDEASRFLKWARDENSSARRVWSVAPGRNV